MSNSTGVLVYEVSTSVDGMLDDPRLKSVIGDKGAYPALRSTDITEPLKPGCLYEVTVKIVNGLATAIECGLLGQLFKK